VRQATLYRVAAP